jgi:hypothetical protein
LDAREPSRSAARLAILIVATNWTACNVRHMDAGELPISGPELRVLTAIGALLQPSSTQELADGMQLATARVEQLALSLQRRGLASFDGATGWLLSPAGRALAPADDEVDRT